MRRCCSLRVFVNFGLAILLPQAPTLTWKLLEMSLWRNNFLILEALFTPQFHLPLPYLYAFLLFPEFLEQDQVVRYRLFSLILHIHNAARIIVPSKGIRSLLRIPSSPIKLQPPAATFRTQGMDIPTWKRRSKIADND